MAVTVQTLYQQALYICMEDNGFVLGLFSEQQFLDVLGVVILDFAQRAALYKNIYTQKITAGTSVYAIPDDVMKPELAFVGGKIIEKVAEADLTQGHFEWRSKSDSPRQWHEDNLPPKQVELFPNPITTGSTDAGTYGKFAPAENNLTVVGPAAPDITNWSLSDPLQCVPDSFTPYILYGILEQIFSSESELRDVQRAAYARARYLEGIALAEALALEDLLEEDY